MKKVVVFIIIGLLVLTTGCSVKKVEELTDAEKFANEFGISKNNPFVYSDIDQIINIFSNGTGVVFFGNSDEESSLKAANILLQASRKTDINNIYYYNPKKEKSPKKYKKLLKIITDYLETEDESYDIHLPDVYSVKDGKIINHSNYFSNKEQLSEEKLTTKKINQIKKEYQKLLNFEE